MIIRKSRYNPEPLFLLYFDYRGDVHAMLKDKRCSIKNYPNLYYFCKRHEFEKRMNGILAVSRKHNNEELAKVLVIHKKYLLAMCKQIFIKYLRAITEENRRVNSRDLLIAWKMYKRETKEFLAKQP